MNKKVRVLQVLDFINHNSGVSAVVMNYYTHLTRERVSCDFLLYESAEHDLEAQIRANGSKIYLMGQPSGSNLAECEKRVEKFFAEHAREYDVVHVHIPNAAFIVLRMAKKYGVPDRVLHSHNARGADGTLKKIRNFVLNKWGISYANYYMACSQKAGAYLFGNRKVKQGKVVVLNNAIELEKYQYNSENREKLRGELGVGDELILGHVGRFSEQKNHSGLIEIFAKLQERGVPSKLLLLGDGSLRPQIEQLAREKGVFENVIFQGIVSNVEEYMSVMDVFLLPSLYEGLPVVCVEAQAAGLPCIVSANVTREIALTDRVEFIENEKITQWCDEIEQLASQLPDRSQCMPMDAYDIRKQARRLEEIYLSYGMGTDTDVHL